MAGWREYVWTKRSFVSGKVHELNGGLSVAHRLSTILRWIGWRENWQEHPKKKNLGKSKVSCTRSPKLINQSIEMAFIRFISVFIVGLQPGLLMIPPSSPTKEGSSHLVSCPSDLKCPIMPLSYFQNYDDELASHKPSLGKSPYLCLCSIPFVSHHMVILFPLISALIYRSDFPDFRLWYLKTCP